MKTPLMLSAPMSTSRPPTVSVTIGTSARETSSTFVTPERRGGEAVINPLEGGERVLLLPVPPAAERERGPGAVVEQRRRLGERDGHVDVRAAVEES